MSDPPKVILAVAGQKQWPKPDQTYERVITKFQFKQNNAVDFYNSILDAPEKFDIYGFIESGVTFSSTNALQSIIDLFSYNENISAVYSDYITKGKTVYLDPFHIKMQPINTSIFIHGRICQNIRFTTENNIFAQLVNQNLLIAHLAEPLLSTYE